MIIGRYLNEFKINGTISILSPRELDNLVHMTFGFSAKEIAKHLNISTGTVNTYVTRIRDKLNIRTQTELIALLTDYAIAKHLVDYLKQFLCSP